MGIIENAKNNERGIPLNSTSIIIYENDDPRNKVGKNIDG
jgi:hypothetical protein